jgi:hypothetical protein
MTVLVQVAEIAGEWPPLLDHLAKQRLDLAAVIGMHHLGRAESQRLLLGVSEEAAIRGVHALEAPVAVDDRHAGRGVGEDPPEMLAGGVERVDCGFGLTDVAGRCLKPDRLGALVADHARDDLDPHR